jgi:hypothetical protein
VDQAPLHHRDLEDADYARQREDIRFAQARLEAEEPIAVKAAAASLRASRIPLVAGVTGTTIVSVVRHASWAVRPVTDRIAAVAPRPELRV